MKERPAGPDWLPYVAPMIAFVVLTSLEGMVPAGGYPIAYGVKIALVTTVAVLCRAAWRDLQPRGRDLAPAVGVGLLACALWIGLDRWPGYPHLGGRAAFNPFQAIPDPAGRAAFLAVRLFGLVALVPLIEELFWRSLLLRYVTRPEQFLAVPPHQFTAAAALVSGLGFTLAHPEWLAAAVTAALYTLLLKVTRSVFACVVAHAVTNCCLGIYVLATGAWAYW